jgi:hypothetical protein
MPTLKRRKRLRIRKIDHRQDGTRRDFDMVRKNPLRRVFAFPGEI